MMGNLGFGEMLVIVLILVVLFGAKKIPDLAQGLGKGIRDFKKALNEDEPSKQSKDSSDEKKS